MTPCGEDGNGGGGERQREDLVARYERWVLAHTGLARNIESLLYIAPQLVPKQLVDPEIATQSGYSIVGLLGLYHDHILFKATPAAAAANTTCERLTRLARVPLSLVSHVQVLAEAIARKWGGEPSRWRLIVWVELFKCVCKILLLLQQRRALLLGGGRYKAIHPPGAQASPFARFAKSNPKRGSRTGKVFKTNKTTHSASEDIPTETKSDATPVKSITFENPTLQANDVRREHLLLGGELLHAVRPVAYAILRQHRSEESWVPAMVSLFMEVAGLVLSASAFESEGFSPSAQAITSKLVQDELTSRKMALFLYLLRDPVYGKFTKPATQKICDATDYVPVLGKVLRLVSFGLMDYYHNFHFYTSAS